MRRVLAIAALAACMCAAISRADAQRAIESPLDSARAAAPKKEKDPTTATLLGFVPGVGHLYAEDLNRGWLIILLYSVGAGISMSGRTDTVGKIGGTLAVGGFLFSIIDAGKAARRYNERLAKERDAAPADTLRSAAPADTLRSAAPADTLKSPDALGLKPPDAPRLFPGELVPDR